MTPQ
jgi:hypothetical protein